MPTPNYDHRYLKGVQYFNSHDYFASHEVWEDLWLDSKGADKGYYKGLIQAAVSLHHLTQGNKHGAGRLLAGCTRYLTPYCPRHLGLDVEEFLTAMTRCVGQAVARSDPLEQDQPYTDCWPDIRLSQASDDPLIPPQRLEAHEQL